MNKSTFWWLGLYVLLLTLYSLWSFSLTDPNLVLSSWSPYWQFQQWMWQTFFHHSQLLTGSFVLLMIGLCLTWSGLMQSLTPLLRTRQLLIGVAIVCLPLCFSYNALSHDVFNYIFNAKIVVVYHQNPHQKVALDFPQDPWIRFMHNTHTPAPYGYGWTVFSVLPFWVGVQKFTLTWLVFRGLSILAVPLLIGSIIGFAKEFNIKLFIKDLAMVVLHPLFLIELISNSHNDLWMLVPGVAALWLGKRGVRQKNLPVLLLSALLLLFSISTKLATVVLIPIWVSGWCELIATGSKPNFPVLIRHWGTLVWALVQSNAAFLASVLLFLPLLSSRSQIFNPWYLVWPLIWFPLVKVRWWRNFLLVLAVSSLFRYVPWLLAGGFSEEIIHQQRAITWIGGGVGCGLWYVWSRRQKRLA